MKGKSFHFYLNMKLNDNDKCWCGSNECYSSCHKEFDLKIEKKRLEGYKIPPHKMIKNKNQIEGIRKAAIINNGLLDIIGEKIQERMSTNEINQICVNFLRENNAMSADYKYQGYPKHICTSINDVVCHGIPNDNDILKAGDIINCDATTVVDKYYADASRMYAIGKISPNAEKLIRVTKECLDLAIQAIVPYETTLNDIAKVIENHAHKNGYSIVEEYCGHGVGLSMHEDPYVLHYSTKEDTYLIVPGMVFTIEPMINEGKRYITLDSKDNWTVRTKDHKLSAQVEHTILITETGVEILSK